MAHRLRLCPVCGQKTTTDANFCSRCGHTFSATPATDHQGTNAAGRGGRPPSKSWFSILGVEHAHESHWPHIYSTKPGTAGLNLKAMMMVLYSPEKGLVALYPAAGLKNAVPVLLLTGIAVWALGATTSQADLAQQVGLLMNGLIGYLLFFLFLAGFAWAMSKWFYGGRSDFKTTLSLLIFCTPALFIWMSALFGVTTLISGTNEGLMFIAVLALLLIGGLWFYVLYAAAISVANDLTQSAGLFTGLAGAFVASALLDLVSYAVHPIGLEVTALFIPINLLDV